MQQSFQSLHFWMVNFSNPHPADLQKQIILPWVSFTVSVLTRSFTDAASPHIAEWVWGFYVRGIIFCFKEISTM